MLIILVERKFYILFLKFSGFRIFGFSDFFDFGTGVTGSSMGNYFFTTTGGDEIKVEFSFQYIRNPTPPCGLKIVNHHSSLPYTPPSEDEED